MSRAKFKSRLLSVFTRIFLLTSWAMLVCALIISIILTLWPNILSSEYSGTFGVWRTTKNKITTNISGIGIFLIIFSSVSVVFSMIIQFITKKSKFKIGKNNQILGYFSSITFPLVVFTVFAFVGSMKFNSLNLPGISKIESQSLLYTTTGLKSLINNSVFPLKNNIHGTVTWIWWLFFVFAIISSIGVVFTTVKLIIRALFNKTHDKENNY